jgi:hypothetical protein
MSILLWALRNRCAEFHHRMWSTEPVVVSESKTVRRPAHKPEHERTGQGGCPIHGQRVRAWKWRSRQSGREPEYEHDEPEHEPVPNWCRPGGAHFNVATGSVARRMILPACRAGPSRASCCLGTRSRPALGPNPAALFGHCWTARSTDALPLTGVLR